MARTAKTSQDIHIDRLLCELSRHCTVFLPEPWKNTEPPPQGVFSPRLDANRRYSLAPAALNEIIERNQRILVWLHTSSSLEQLTTIEQVMPQVSALHLEHVCVLALQPKMKVIDSKAEIDAIIQRRESMIKCGIDDLLVVPYSKPEAVHRAIKLAQVTWEVTVKRFQHMIQMESDVHQGTLPVIEREFRKLMWESIPSILMPGFPQINRNIVEKHNAIGSYKIVKKFKTMRGTVFRVVDLQDEDFAIKVFEKTKVNTPIDLERIYHEFHIISTKIRHPNIVHCLTMLHSINRVYLVLDFGGSHNLANWVSSCPGERLDPESSIVCFAQVARGLAYCHNLQISHRSVSLEHVVLAGCDGADTYRYKLVDFHWAIMGDKPAQAICGGLPCIAPEMAMGDPYVPSLADCWSLGVLLIEISGGLSSLHRTVRYGPLDSLREAAKAIKATVRDTDFHRQVLTYMSGNCADPAILHNTQMLVKVLPTERSGLRDLVVNY